MYKRFLVCLWRLTILGLLSMLVGCVSLGSESVPDWIEGRSQQFPRELYLIGRGEADSRELAEQRAYAALARTFSARVIAQFRDNEVYLQMDRDDLMTSERKVSLDHLTQVSTDKVLENVEILDAWHSLDKERYFALVGLDRAKTERILVNRISSYDQMIRSNLENGQNETDVLTKIRGLKRALRDLQLREVVNTDLQIVRLTGERVLSPYPVATIRQELNNFLLNHVRVAIHITGQQQSPIQQAIREGLRREGFVSLGQQSSSIKLNDSDPTMLAKPTDLVIRGSTRLDNLKLFDPLFKYVRWCSDLQIVESENQQIIGVISRSGKEGHVTQQAARVRALQAMQEAVSEEISQSLAHYIYDDDFVPRSPSASCLPPK